jgi:hypothetical protein
LLLDSSSSMNMNNRMRPEVPRELLAKARELSPLNRSPQDAHRAPEGTWCACSLIGGAHHGQRVVWCRPRIPSRCSSSCYCNFRTRFALTIPFKWTDEEIARGLTDGLAAGDPRRSKSEKHEERGLGLGGERALPPIQLCGLCRRIRRGRGSASCPVSQHGQEARKKRDALAGSAMTRVPAGKRRGAIAPTLPLQVPPPDRAP